MRLQSKKQMSETFLIGSMLAVVGGFLDAYTYIARGGVFANAQTGNIVLLGMNIASGQWEKVVYYLVPILSFAVGVMVAEAIKSYFKRRPAIHWRQIVLLVEIFVLLGVAFIPQGTLDLAAYTAVSFICSLQVESFRKVNGNAFATTMCTGNLRSGTELLFRFFHTGEGGFLRRALQYFGIILFFLIGAVIGFYMTELYGLYSIFFCCLLLFLVFLILFIRSEEKSDEKDREQRERMSRGKRAAES